MRNMLVACGHNEKNEFVEAHFGDSPQYSIFDVQPSEIRLIKTINNTTMTEEEDFEHGDPKKARAITMLFKELGVQVLVGRRFGPNIKRIVKTFVPVIVNCKTVEEGVEIVRENLDKIKEEYDKKEGRTHIKLKK